MYGQADPKSESAIQILTDPEQILTDPDTDPDRSWADPDTESLSKSTKKSKINEKVKKSDFSGKHEVLAIFPYFVRVYVQYPSNPKASLAARDAFQEKIKNFKKKPKKIKKNQKKPIFQKSQKSTKKWKKVIFRKKTLPKTIFFTRKKGESVRAPTKRSKLWEQKKGDWQNNVKKWLFRGETYINSGFSVPRLAGHLKSGMS